jgi:type II secretory pathway pseudopilin PulG
MIFMKKNILQKNKAFTLVETMVAIAILMIAILGPMDIASSGLRDSLLARDQATAYYLAQEGIEYVRYVRDYNFLQTSNGVGGLAWLTGLGDITTSTECFSSYGCTIDSLSFFTGYINGNPAGFVNSCNSSGCIPLNFNTGGEDYYTQASGGNQTKFTRTIKIVPVVGAETREVQVRSNVSWQSGTSALRNFTITENIFNLYQ